MSDATESECQKLLSFQESLTKKLVEVWYSAEDWGEDTFTETWDEVLERGQKELLKAVFEATIFYAVQELLLGGTGLEVLQAIVLYRIFQGDSVTPDKTEKGV